MSVKHDFIQKQWRTKKDAEVYMANIKITKIIHVRINFVSDVQTKIKH